VICGGLNSGPVACIRTAQTTPQATCDLWRAQVGTYSLHSNCPNDPAGPQATCDLWRADCASASLLSWRLRTLSFAYGIELCLCLLTQRQKAHSRAFASTPWKQQNRGYKDHHTRCNTAGPPMSAPVPATAYDPNKQAKGIIRAQSPERRPKRVGSAGTRALS
jgi:hypothetical protein